MTRRQGEETRGEMGRHRQDGETRGQCGEIQARYGGGMRRIRRHGSEGRTQGGEMGRQRARRGDNGRDGETRYGGEFQGRDFGDKKTSCGDT